MTPDDALGRKATRMLERAIDAGLAAAPEDHDLLRIGYDAANMLLHNRLVTPVFERDDRLDSVDGGSGEDASDELNSSLLHVDPLVLEVGAGLAGVGDSARDDELLAMLRDIRRDIASEYGLITPGVRIRPRTDLGASEFVVVVQGDPVARQDLGADADVDTLSSFVRATITNHLDEFLTREEVAELLNFARVDSPMVVQELVPNSLSLGQLRQVLQILLREQVPIRNLPLILNVLADNSVYTKDPYALAENVRTALGRRICARYRSGDGSLHVIQLHPDTERAVQNSIQLNETGQVLLLDPNTSSAIERSLAEVMTTRGDDEPVVVVTPAKLRRHVRTLLARNHPDIVVLGAPEIEDGPSLRIVGTVDAGDPARPLPTDEPPARGDVDDVGSMRW
jgi:flagellar biosynthesis protein FlhA